MFVVFLAALASASPSADVPDGVETARQLLLARHATDLPGHAVLLAHGGAASLAWLATNDPSLSVRERALLSLHAFPDAADRAVCRAVFTSDVHAKLRAAAIHCHRPEDLVDPALLALVTSAVDAPDRRVALASAELLATRRPRSTSPGE